jgi:hypothetical protein
MGRAAKGTDEQRLEIAMDMLAGKMAGSEVCRKWDIGRTYDYKLMDRAIELLRTGIAKPAGRASGEVERLRKKVVDLEQLAGDHSATSATVRLLLVYSRNRQPYLLPRVEVWLPVFQCL